MDERLLDDYVALKDPERRRQVERRGGFFIVEGLLAVGALVRSRYPVRSILVAERKAEAVADLLRSAPYQITAGADDDGEGDGWGPRTGVATVDPRGEGVGVDVPVIVRPDEEVAAATGFAFHRGVLASGQRLPLPPLGELLTSARTVAVLEGLNDHENLGALFRNAAAFGVDAVVLDPTTADPLYRRSVRVSIGHVLRIPWTRVEGWPDTLDELRHTGFFVAALTPSPDAMPIDELVADPPSRVAFVVGAEGPGLTDAALAAADARVRIPLAPGVDSLNVATAAAIAFHRLRSAGR